MRFSCKYILFHTALVASFLLCFNVKAQAIDHSFNSDEEALLRQILAHQPDFMADQQFIFDEGFGGFGARSRVAKLRFRMREATDDRIFLYERGKPTIKIDMKRKEYSEMPSMETDGFSIEPEELATRDDLTLRSLGTEKVGEYRCRKIEVSYKDEKLKEMKFSFCAVPELKNLVIKRQIFMGPVTATTVLSRVSFNVPEDLFSIPQGYRKVVDESDGSKSENNPNRP